jgi:hypothetical protein
MNKLEKGKHNPSLEEFIEGASKETTAKKARKRTSNKDLLLILTGALRREECTKPILLFPKNDIKQDIEKYCSGNNQVIFNYLLRKGLDKIIEDNELIIEECS